MTRNLETLIQEFNQVNQVDIDFMSRGRRLEVEGIHTTMFDIWIKGLSSEEKNIPEIQRLIKQQTLGDIRYWLKFEASQRIINSS